MEQYLWIIWLAVFVLSLLIEWATSELVSIWFTLGSVVALILSLIPGVEWWVELIIFTVISVAAFLFLRPILKKLIKTSKVDTNIDEIIGKRGYMTASYSDVEAGEVKINGVLWTAVNSVENEPIEKGAKVVVAAIQGNKLIVKKIKEDK